MIETEGPDFENCGSSSPEVVLLNQREAKTGLLLISDFG